MKIQDLINQATLFLKPTSPTARLDAEVIISHVLKCSRTSLYVDSKKTIEPNTLTECLQKIERRIQGEPVAYITNTKEFLNHTLYVQKGVLVPRPETELLVEYCLQWIEDKNLTDVWILDIGTGSGAISVSILKEVYSSKAIALDISEVAIQTAQKNAKDLKVEDRMFIKQSDADNIMPSDFASYREHGFAGQFDIVVSNPPYIDEKDVEVQDSVKKHEPKEALFCIEEGLEKIRKWTLKASELLKPGGLWAFEIGYKQGLAAKKILNDTLAFENIEVCQDYSGKDRFVIASRVDHAKINNSVKYQS